MLRTQRYQHHARIRVVGVGGNGCQAVNRLRQRDLPAVTFTTVHTDQGTAAASLADARILLQGERLSGEGTQGDYQMGKRAAAAAYPVLRQSVDETDLVFVVAGLGGGTGSGVAPIVAKAAHEARAVTIAMVTTPFHFEQRERLEAAAYGLAQLQRYADVLIVIANDRLLALNGSRRTVFDMATVADDLLYQAIEAITRLVNVPGLVNVDFSDIRSIMVGGDLAVVGTGRGYGPDRARQAAEEAMSSSLLGLTIDGARGAIFNITGGPDLSLLEVNQAAALIHDQVDPYASLFFGATIDPALADEVQITVLATGLPGADGARTARLTVGPAAETMLPFDPLPERHEPDPEAPDRPRSAPLPRFSLRDFRPGAVWLGRPKDEALVAG